MLYEDYTTKLLGIANILVKEIEENEKEIVIHLDTAPKSCTCPHCMSKTSKIHDYRIQRIKDTELRCKHVILSLRKRRYVCPSCGKRFYEDYDFFPKYYRMTGRVYQSILQKTRSKQSFTDIAKQMNISTSTVIRIFKLISYGIAEVTDTIAIDEFKGNCGYEKYQFIICDPKRKKVLDILPTREKHYLEQYFSKLPNRKDIKFVIMDMWKPYRDICYLFPNAKIIVDKYHYVRQVYWALENVRKRIQKKFGSHKRKFMKHSKRILCADYNNLGDETKLILQNMLNQDDDLYVAWQLKELFIEFRNSTDREQAKKLLRSWILTAQESKLPEFYECTKTFLNWFEYILNSVEYNLTNAYTEGMNNNIKVIKRIAYGYRNFDNFRKRILHIVNS